MVGYKWNKSTIQYLIWLPISSKSPFISYEEKGFWFVVSFDKIIKKRSFLSILLWPKNWKKILTLCSSVCIVILQDSQWCCWVTSLGQFASFDFLISAENAHFLSSFITKISCLENNLLTDLCPRFLTLHSRKAVRPMEALTLAWIPLMSRLGGSCNVEDGTMIAEPTIIPGKSLGNANGSSGWSGNGEDCIVLIANQFS